MHKYAIFHHSRDTVGRWLGVSSLLLSGVLVDLLAWMQAISGLGTFTKISIATASIYFTLHWLFNKFGWRAKFLGIPNLNGVWRVDGKTLNPEGGALFNWSGELLIEQSWTNILVTQKTKESQSYSYTATLFKRGGDQSNWMLTYSYKNEPKLEKCEELSAHRGYCEIEFDLKLESGQATYFNNAGRKTAGVMELSRTHD